MLKVQKFGSKLERDEMRRSTLNQNITSGLTPALPLPHTERVSSFDRFKKNMDKNKEFK